MFIVIWILCGVAASAIGSNKGYKGIIYFILGCFLGPFGIILAACDAPVTISCSENKPGYIKIRMLQTIDYNGHSYIKDTIYNMKDDFAKIMVNDNNAVYAKENEWIDNNVNTNNKIDSNKDNAPEQIKKYKELLDEGIITQEEFEKKKKELLGL